MTTNKKDKNIVLSFVFDPFTRIAADKLSFFLWFTFTIVAGQLGIILNIISRFYRDGMSIKQSIFLDATDGSFYTFSIALAASMLGLVFSEFIRKSKLEFTSMKIIFVTLIIFFLIFSSVIFSSVSQSGNVNWASVKIIPDYSQISIYLASIMLSVYGYGLLKLKNPENSNLDDPALFHDEDDNNVAEKISDSALVNDDGYGTKI